MGVNIARSAAIRQSNRVTVGTGTLQTGHLREGPLISYQAQPVSRSVFTRKGHERMHARGLQVKVALGRVSLVVDDSDRKLSQRRVGRLFFLKCGVEELYCPVYAQLTGPSLQSAVA
jgi:hypothetical protein